MYKVVIKHSGGTEEQDEVFETESDANDYGLYYVSCYNAGTEVLHMSNPGDYPLDSDNGVDFDIIELDD